MCISLTQKVQWLDLHKEAIHIHRRWDGTRLPMYHSTIEYSHKAQWLDLHKEVIHIHRRWDGTRLLMYHSTIEYCNSLEQMIENL